jgi:geranylgeranyl pyrophosphate synthase
VGAIEYTQKMAVEYAEAAKQKLDFLSDSEEKSILTDFVDFMVKREH